MQSKLKEMLMVIRPTNGNGLIPTAELESVLSEMGFEFLTIKVDEIIADLDQQGSGFFNQDEFVDYLMNKYVNVYADANALKQAIKTFDYDNDGKIPYEEFEYFMKNFGETENFYMDESKLQTLLECAKPLDKTGNIEVSTLLNNISSWYVLNKKKKS